MKKMFVFSLSLVMLFSLVTPSPLPMKMLATEHLQNKS